MYLRKNRNSEKTIINKGIHVLYICVFLHTEYKAL